VTDKVRNLKGVNFHGTLKAVERIYGADTRARIEKRVAGEAGEALRAKAIVTAGWYPASWYDAVLRAIEEEFPNDKRICRDVARAAVTDDFATLFKIISLVFSVESALKTATKVAARYIDGGKITLVKADEGSLHFKFEDYVGYTARMWDDFIGGIEAVLDLMKVERLPTKIISGGGDGDKLELLLRFRARP
jgi:hypothetical protein